ncbi:hypothetical protein [Streptomyces sp. NPDC046862]|uniref:hypothetical protein n=1 Tax=Streptomyces sp. NPDC046862 TaxID=3154603 RepID=UPI0034561A92
MSEIRGFQHKRLEERLGEWSDDGVTAFSRFFWRLVTEIGWPHGQPLPLPSLILHGAAPARMP